MRHVLLFCLFVLIHTTSVQLLVGQSIKITPKKVTYTRPKVNAADDALNVKTFTIVYPKVRGANGKKIETLLDYETAFEFKIKEETEAERGLQQANYKILYNNKNILSVKLTIDVYTFSDLHYDKFITVNTKTAKLIEPDEVFTNLNGLAAKCRKSQLKAINDVKKDFSPDEYGTIFDSVNFTTKELKGFTISRKGITFHYPYRFARTAILYEPNDDYFFGWAELKPFIKRDGLLGIFIR